MNSQSFYPQYQPDNQQFQMNPMMQNQMMQQFQQFFQPSHENYQFQNEFPRCNDYNDPRQIAATFEHLNEVNTIQFDQDMKPARFFVLRSSNDDDIHKAIKYNLWTSTPNNNIFLEKLFQECQQTNTDIYFFYSQKWLIHWCSKNGIQFYQQEILILVVKSQIPLTIWTQMGLYQRYFLQFIKWYQQRVNLIKQSEGNSITRSKDCTEIDFQNGKKVLEIFNNANAKLSIFQDFKFMDMREDMLRNHINLVRQQKQQGQE